MSSTFVAMFDKHFKIMKDLHENLSESLSSNKEVTKEQQRETKTTSERILASLADMKRAVSNQEVQVAMDQSSSLHQKMQQVSNNLVKLLGREQVPDPTAMISNLETQVYNVHQSVRNVTKNLQDAVKTLARDISIVIFEMASRPDASEEVTCLHVVTCKLQLAS